MTNTIIDPIIYFKERNSYFFVPLHDGWRFTKVNNQPPSATELLWVLSVMECIILIIKCNQALLKSCVPSVLASSDNTPQIMVRKCPTPHRDCY